MSRVGLKPVDLPAGVEVKVDEKNVVTVKGPKAQLSEQISDLITVDIKENQVLFSTDSDAKAHREQHGLARALVANMVEGVTKEFEIKLEIQGVGYRVEKKGKTLVMNLGFSHPIEMEDPEGITTEAPSATQIVVRGSDKAIVGNYAANIRKWRKPEPYKGKGIRYEGEQIRRKEGKAGVKSE